MVAVGVILHLAMLAMARMSGFCLVRVAMANGMLFGMALSSSSLLSAYGLLTRDTPAQWAVSTSTLVHALEAVDDTLRVTFALLAEMMTRVGT